MKTKTRHIALAFALALVFFAVLGIAWHRAPRGARNALPGRLGAVANTTAVAGDVTGVLGASTVSGLQGLPLSATPPVNGQVLGWNGSTWLPAPGGGGATPTGTGLAKVSAGAFAGAASLLLNADVDPVAAIAGSKVAPNFGAQDVLAQRFGASTGNPATWIPTSVSIAGGTTTTLAAGAGLESPLLVLTGAVTADKQLTLPLVNGAFYRIVNNATGAFLVFAGGATGSGVVVPTNGVTDVWSNGVNYYYASGPINGSWLEWKTFVTFSGCAVPCNNDIAVAKLPGKFQLARVYVHTTSNWTGGSTFLSVGTTAGGTDIILSSRTPVAAIKGLGSSTADLGSAMLASDSYEAYLDTVTTLYFRQAQTGSPATAGASMVYISGYQVN